MCQDTGSAVVMGKKSEGVLRGTDDGEAISQGVHDAYTCFQETKAILNPERMLEFLDEKIRSLGTAACPPHHLAVVIGGTSAEFALKTAKYASARYLDSLPTHGSMAAHGFRTSSSSSRSSSPAKTPEGYASGSFGPTTAGRMDSYVEQFQAAGGSMVMLAKGNRSKPVAEVCHAHGSFCLGSIGGPAARLTPTGIRVRSAQMWPSASAVRRDRPSRPSGPPSERHCRALDAASSSLACLTDVGGA